MRQVARGIILAVLVITCVALARGLYFARIELADTYVLGEMSVAKAVGIVRKGHVVLLQFDAPELLTDEVFQYATELKAVRKIVLLDAPLTDKSLASLERIKTLKTIVIFEGNRFTAQGLAKFVRRRPDVSVIGGATGIGGR